MNREARLSTLLQQDNAGLFDEDDNVERYVMPDGNEIEYQKGFPPFALTKVTEPESLQQELKSYILKMHGIFAVQVFAILGYAWYLNGLMINDKKALCFATSNIIFGVSIALYLGISTFLAAQISMQYGRVLLAQFLLYLVQTLSLGYIVGYAAVKSEQTQYAQNLLVIILGCAGVVALLRTELAKEQVWTSKNKVLGIGVLCLIAGLAKLMTLDQTLEQFFYLAFFGMAIFMYMTYDTHAIINGKSWSEDVSKHDVFFGAAKISFDLLVLSFVMILVTLVMAMLCGNDNNVDMDDGFSRIPEGSNTIQSSHVDGQHFWEFGGQSQLGQSVYNAQGGDQGALGKSTLGKSKFQDVNANEETIKSVDNLKVDGKHLEI